ncbi:MAG: glycosyltransferase family 4 protein [Desulfobacterota bacterium]|nr:glycosyltransferase family 4 protein [Thermodesulfobacteriota bacterium]
MGNQSPCSVLFVIRYFYPFIGGLEVNTLRLAQALVDCNVPVTVVTARWDGISPRKDQIHNVPIIRLPSPRIKVLGALLFLAALSWHLLKNRKRYDIIHAFQIGYTAAIAVAVGAVLRKPTLITVASSGSGGDVQRHCRTPWGRLFLFLCKYASCMITLNQLMRTELQAIGYPETKMMSIPNGVDTSIFRPPIQSEQEFRQKCSDQEKIILYAGRLSPEKGVAFLVRAFATLAPHIPAQLFIVGDGPEKKHLESIIVEQGLSNRVCLIPAVEHLVPLLHSADVFVLPSLFEGLSNALLEAMACGLPVIATRVAGNQEVIRDGENGMLVPAQDSDALAAAIAFLCTQPEHAQRLGCAAVTTVRTHYNLDRIVVHYMQLYRELVNCFRKTP